MPLLAPVGGLLARLMKHPATDFDDHPRVLEDGDELVGPHDASHRMSPPEEGFNATYAHIFEVKHGLVQEEELPASECRAQLHLPLEAIEHGGLHLRLEERNAPLADGLRPIQRDVGIAQ